MKSKQSDYNRAVDEWATSEIEAEIAAMKLGCAFAFLLLVSIISLVPAGIALFQWVRLLI